MSAPPQANREWLGNRNACQKALWTVVVYQQMNDYADFVMKVRAEQTEFYGALDEALDLDTHGLRPGGSFTLRRGRAACFICADVVAYSDAKEHYINSWS